MILTRVSLMLSLGVSPSTAAVEIACRTSIPRETRANAVYLPSSELHAPVQTKNDVVALAGSLPRAIETTPDSFLTSENSGSRLRTSFCCTAVSG